MARGPRSIEGIKRAVLNQKEAWRKNRHLAQARANVSGFGSLVGVFFAVSFACFAFISHQPWFIFGGLAIGSLVFSWQAILSAERHIGSVPYEWKLEPVQPFSVRLTHKVGSLPVLPDTSNLVVNRTLAKHAQLVLAAQLKASPPARAALDHVIKISEDAVVAALWDAPRIEKILKAARARPKDLGVQVSASTMRHRFQLPALSIEAVTANLLAALSSDGGPDVNSIRTVGRELAELLRAPAEGSQAALDDKAGEEAGIQDIDAVESGREHRTLTGRTVAPGASAPAMPAAPTAAEMAATAAAANAAATQV